MATVTAPGAAGVGGPERPTLAQYQRHAELFGPECVVISAARDLSDSDLAQLSAYVQHLDRTQKFVRGSWQPRHTKPPRKCEGCGLDLPVSARKRRFHDKACRDRAYRRKARSDASPPSPGNGTDRSGKRLASPPQAPLPAPESAEQGVLPLDGGSP